MNEKRSEDDFIIIGQILKTRGLKGEVKVYPLTGRLERFDELNAVFIDGVQYEIEWVKYLNRFIVLKFKGIDDSNSGESLRRKYIKIFKTESYKPSEDEYFYYEIEGLTVIGLDGSRIGEIIEILDYPANDVYVVKTLDNREIMLPAVKDVIKEIDLSNRIVRVDLLKGLAD